MQHNSVFQNLTTYVVDDDDAVRDALSLFLEVHDIPHVTFASADAFFKVYDSAQPGCLILDVRMPGMDGLELQQKLKAVMSYLPIIFISGHGDIPLAVEVMRQGALDFMRKPIKQDLLLKRIKEAYQQVIERQQVNAELGQYIKNHQRLTKREREIFVLVCNGASNKLIASDLSISERTVEVHRSNVMQKLNVKNLPEMVKVKMLLDQAQY